MNIKSFHKNLLFMLFAWSLLFNMQMAKASAPDANAVEKLQAFNIRLGISQPMAAVGMRSLTNDPGLAGAVYSTPYYGDPSYFTSGITIAAEALAAIDLMAVGQNPRKYEKNIVGTTQTETCDLIAEILECFQEDGSFSYKENMLSCAGAGNLYAVMALEMFYNGRDWGKEGGTEKQTRIGAIETLLGYFKDCDHTAWNIEGGRYYTSGSLPASNFIFLNNQFRTQLDVSFLLARWLDDETLVSVDGIAETEPLKDIAARELTGMATTYQAFYLGEINSSIGSKISAAIQDRSVTLSVLISALIAAGQRDTVDEMELIELLDKFRMDRAEEFVTIDPNHPQYPEFQSSIELYDGGYRYSFNGTGFCREGTAMAAMALGDYLNNRSMMAHLFLDLDISDMDTVLWDLDGLSIPETVTEDLALLNVGTYGALITWESSDCNIIDPVTGSVVRPSSVQGDAVVVLTATAGYGGASDSKEFIVTVTAQLSEDQETVRLDIEALTVPVFTIEDINLPIIGAFGSDIFWETSDANLVDIDGTVFQDKFEDQATLTATVSCGEATKQVVFVVTIGQEITEGDLVTQAMVRMRQYYEDQRKLNGGYWGVLAAKAVVGDDFDRYDFEVYNVKNHKKTRPWTGSDYGAVILQILAQGDNPYDYQGVNYVESMLAYVTEKDPDGLYWGMYSEPIFLAMALNATAEMSPEMFKSVRGILNSQLLDYAYGPDLAGWAMVPLAQHLDVNDAYTATIMDSLDYLRDILLSSLITDEDDENYGLIVVNPTLAGYVHAVSDACVLIGSVAVTQAGIDGFDLYNGQEWLQDDGTSIIDPMYDYSFTEEVGEFDTQVVIAFGDLYHGTNVWTDSGVTVEKLTSLLAIVQPVVDGDGIGYTVDSFLDLCEAYDAASVYLETEAEYGFGESYFNLRDAYNNLELFLFSVD